MIDINEPFKYRILEIETEIEEELAKRIEKIKNSTQRLEKTLKSLSTGRVDSIVTVPSHIHRGFPISTQAKYMSLLKTLDHTRTGSFQITYLIAPNEPIFNNTELNKFKDNYVSEMKNSHLKPYNQRSFKTIENYLHLMGSSRMNRDVVDWNTSEDKYNQIKAIFYPSSCVATAVAYKRIKIFSINSNQILKSDLMKHHKEFAPEPTLLERFKLAYQHITS